MLVKEGKKQNTHVPSPSTDRSVLPTSVIRSSTDSALGSLTPYKFSARTRNLYFEPTGLDKKSGELSNFKFFFTKRIEF